jgi:predicted dehydrogenase
MSWLVAADPVRVAGFGGRRVYVPEEDAPERCSACERVCPYRTGPEPKAGERQDMLRTDKALSWLGGNDVLTRRDICVFQPGADILDHAVVNLSFENGVVGQLFYSIFGFDTDDQETVEIVGDEGRIRLIRHTGELHVASDYGKTEDVVDARDENHGSFHFGADARLVHELRRFAEGGTPVVGCREGHTASAAVFAALESIERDGTAVDIRRAPRS